MKINKTVLNGILEKLVNLSNGTSIKFSRDELIALEALVETKIITMEDEELFDDIIEEINQMAPKDEHRQHPDDGSISW